MRTQNDLALTDWLWLAALALFAMPVVGVFAALLALDVTRSLEAHVAIAVVVPAAVVALAARQFRASGGVTLRLALIAAMFSMVLLDLGWSGVPGS